MRILTNIALLLHIKFGSIYISTNINFVYHGIQIFSHIVCSVISFVNMMKYLLEKSFTLVRLLLNTSF